MLHVLSGSHWVKIQLFNPESAKAQTSIINHNLKEVYFSIFKLLNIISSTSILLATNSVMVVFFGFFLFKSTIVSSLLLASFLVTFGVYGLNKVTDTKEDSINQPNSFPKVSSCYLLLSAASMVAGFLIGLWHGYMVFLVLFTPVSIGVIYSVRLSKSIPRLKEITGVKSIVVAASWALTGCLLPASVCGENFQSILIVFLYIFIRIFVGTVLCDVLDTKGDASSGIETIPIKLGEKKTKSLLIIVNASTLLLLFYSLVSGLFFSFLPVLLFGVLYGFLAIWYFFKNNCSRFTARLMLDSEWIPMIIFASLLVC